MRNTNDTDAAARSENILAGIVGAFLFSLAGGVIWFILDRIGFYAGISGIVAVVCAVKGYQVFARRDSKKGVILAVIVSMLTMVLAWYCCLALDVFQAYKEWYAAGEVDFTLTYFQSLRNAYLFLEDWDIAGGYFLNLGIGLLLCIVGSLRFIINAFKSVDAPSAAAQASPVSYTQTQPDYNAPYAQVPQNQPDYNTSYVQIPQEQPQEQPENRPQD